ncbi:MAG: hypothetical protein WHX52_06485 [Anaerolineae bacterium]
MENLLQSLRMLQQRLNDAGILSIVIGGVAVAVWGEPRLTRDADVKVLLERDDADRLLSVLASDYTSLLPDPHQALRRQAMVFVQDPWGTRLDILLADTPYDVLAIQRGRDIEVQPGVTIRVCSPEDLVIYKLISTRLRDHEDAQGVIHRQGTNLDDKYVLNWLRQFELSLDDSTLVAEYKRLRRI